MAKSWRSTPRRVWIIVAVVSVLVLAGGATGIALTVSATNAAAERAAEAAAAKKAEQAAAARLASAREDAADRVVQGEALHADSEEWADEGAREQRQVVGPLRRASDRREVCGEELMCELRETLRLGEVTQSEGTQAEQLEASAQATLHQVTRSPGEQDLASVGCRPHPGAPVDGGVIDVVAVEDPRLTGVPPYAHAQ